MRRANVMGLGLIGGSLALALKKNGFQVSGSDENIETSKSALEREIISAIGVDPLAEISFIATPVSSIPMQAAVALAQTKGIVSDVGGVKEVVNPDAGIVLDKDDIEKLAPALLQAFALKENNIRGNNLGLVCSSLMAKRYDAIYQTLCVWGVWWI